MVSYHLVIIIYNIFISLILFGYISNCLFLGKIIWMSFYISPTNFSNALQLRYIFFIFSCIIIIIINY